MRLRVMGHLSHLAPVLVFAQVPVPSSWWPLGLLLLVATWSILRWHDTRICDRCQVLALRMDNPAALAERRVRTLRAIHAAWNSRSYLVFLAVCLVLPRATRAMGLSFILGSLLVACIITAVLCALLLHSRLMPWCPWCRSGGSEVPAPEPVPSEEGR